MFDNLRHTMDLDDLLFEGRNKEYGAYQLRKSYNNVVAAGVLIASLVTSAIIIIPFLARQSEEDVLPGGFSYVQVEMENLETPPDEFYVPPPPPPPPEAAVAEAIEKYVPPVVVDSVIINDVEPATTDQYLTMEETENLITGGNGNGDELLTGEPGYDSEATYFEVEVMPSFRGGDINTFRDWVQKRTSYPQEAYDRKIRGTVFLTFIVEKDGTVSNVTVVKGVDPLLDEAAAKSISESPKWVPGLQRGQPVRVRFSIPLNFMF